MRPAAVTELTAGDPAEITLENARRKAGAARREGVSEAVLGCDTIVALDGALYGKPRDERPRPPRCARSPAARTRS